MLKLFGKINLRFILDHQTDIFILINYNQGKKKSQSNNKGCEVIKEIVKKTRTNKNKK